MLNFNCYKTLVPFLKNQPWPHKHGDLHTALTQASSDGHSLSELHPGGGRAGTTGRHWPFSLGAQFSGQIHINVLTGVELITLQTALESHGPISLHGSVKKID